MHSVLLHWDLPTFILLPLKSVKMPLQRLSILSASKIIIILTSTSTVLSQNFLQRPDSSMKQCCGVIFTDSLLASLSFRSK